MALLVLPLRYMAHGTKRILIVEDDADWLELLKMIIRRLGYEVVVARTGEECLAQASLTLPDLILMDIGLPGMSGDTATARIKADPATKDIPVVAQTAFGAGTSAQRAVEAGAAEIMHKPISITDIQNVLRKYLSSTEKTPSRSVEAVRTVDSKLFHEHL